MVDNPLSRHLLGILRDDRTDTQLFRETTRRLGYLLTAEAALRLKETSRQIETPLGETTGTRLESDLVAVAVLRAGLGLLGPVQDLIPGIPVGYLGVERNEATARPQAYYAKLPDLRDRTVLLLEPMLATGGSLGWAISEVKQRGGQNLIALCVVAAPQGLERVRSEHPDVHIVTATVDKGLNKNFFIVPGLGDMGDRLFDTT